MKYSSSVFDVEIPNSVFEPRNIPTATKYLTLTYVVLTFMLYYIRRTIYYDTISVDPTVLFSDITVPVLQLVPNKFFHYPYSIVLSNFIDVEIWKFITNLVNLLIGGSFIENNWGSSRELAKFVLIVGSIMNFLVVVIAFTLSVFVPGIKLDVPLDGNYTILIGFPIIYRQLLPETTIINFKTPFSKNFRFKLLPIFIMFFLTAMQLIWFHHFAQLLSIWVTFFSCWIYLRFFQKIHLSILREDSQEVVGDASDTFQLIYFFPDILKPYLRPVFNKFYDLFAVRLALVKPFQLEEIDKGNDIAVQRGAKSTESQAEDRRRQLALQVLQERMA